jgi:hypothetical protein
MPRLLLESRGILPQVPWSATMDTTQPDLAEGNPAMEIKFMWKTRESATGNCPALYKAPGGYVVQGKALDAETKTQLRQFGGDEDAVFVPADVIDRIKGR